MKKSVLAAAIAGAFVTPAFAADVSLSGVVEYQYRVADGSADAMSSNGDTPLFTIKATSELSNGMTVSGDINFDVDTGSNDGGDSITLAGPFGKLDIGDASGAVDSTGDWTDIAPEKGGFGLDGADANMTWTLPSFGNATVILSATPEEGYGGAAEESFGASVTYDLGMAQVYYGTEESKATSNGAADESANGIDVKLIAYGVKTEVAGIYVALESGQYEDSAGTAADGLSKTRYTGLAVQYSMGDVTFGYEKQNINTDGADLYEPSTYTNATTVAASDVSDSELSVGFVSYNFGEGLSAYAEVATDGKNPTADQTTVGIKYAF